MEPTVWIAESVPAHQVFKDEEPPATQGVGTLLILRHRARKSAAKAMANHLHHQGRRQPMVHAMLSAAADTFAASARCDPSLMPVIRIGERVYRLRQEPDPQPTT